MQCSTVLAANGHPGFVEPHDVASTPLAATIQALNWSIGV
jgi:hypothetical protein